ncbi:hypothetical protein ZHAS_00009068 [Anopheles sinensis]|uniref:Glyco_hydro_65m domain-containing protein n=1 Tax=Anopheles sinensis TaxID=74873 RepID=A0A084VU32_ANOSI|nr:hypothetical protein ZHAS_00009068 [Anopheles sinensis]
MATLYNGAGGLSHRARIPNVANLRLQTGCYDGTTATCTLTLNTAQGLFQVEGVFGVPNSSYRVVHRVFPHAFYRRLIVNQVLIERLSEGTGPDIVVHLSPPVPFTSEDIRFQPARTFRVHSSSSFREIIYQRCGRTVEVESRTYQPETRPVCVLWNHVPERLTLAGDGDRKVSFQFVMAVDGDEVVARKELRTALLQSAEELLRAHTSLWGSFWERTDILTTGSGEPLQRTVRASIFYLVSNFPFEESYRASPGPFGGLSPTGLGRGGGASYLDDYEGHSFWDTEIWMLPVLNLIDPWYGRLLVNYRSRLLEVANDLAADGSYAGARFPWESGYTGVEVTQPCCPEVAEYQHHITGDVSYGLRHHFATTQDLVWLQESGCRMVQEIADFWLSRLSFNYTGTGQYDIAGE